jgi:acetyl esterase
MQVLVRLDERNRRPLLPTRTPQEAREDLRHAVRVVEGPPAPLAGVSDTTVAGAEGPLRARLYEPEEARASSRPGPLVVYYHGGGWVAGDIGTHDRPCRLLAKSSGARVLSVEYRCAPEHRFPAPVEDALAAFRDVAARAGELGADRERIAVAGDSAGGHLAAVTAQQSIREGVGPSPAFQLLIYPVTDCVEVAASRVTFAEGFILTKPNMDWYEEQFFGADGDRSDPRGSPLLAGDLSGVAPALVVTAGFDPLRDEGEAYARRLREAGVRTLLRRHGGYVHGFINALANGPGPREAVAEMGGVLRAALAG